MIVRIPWVVQSNAVQRAARRRCRAGRGAGRRSTGCPPSRARELPGQARAIGVVDLDAVGAAGVEPALGVDAEAIGQAGRSPRRRRGHCASGGRRVTSNAMMWWWPPPSVRSAAEVSRHVEHAIRRARRRGRSAPRLRRWPHAARPLAGSKRKTRLAGCSRFGAVAFVVAQDAVGRVGEPDRAVALHDDVVGRVQALALEAVDHDLVGHGASRRHDAARADDGAQAVRAVQQVAIAVARVAVGEFDAVAPHASGRRAPLQRSMRLLGMSLHSTASSSCIQTGPSLQAAPVHSCSSRAPSTTGRRRASKISMQVSMALVSGSQRSLQASV